MNRAIDERLCQLTWDNLEALMVNGGVTRSGILLRHCKHLVKTAQGLWPALLQGAPQSMKDEVLRRLQGKVALCR